MKQNPLPASRLFFRRTNCGFTLIELLVVVIIIAILAAIAFPQYQRAVEKSRGAEALKLTTAIKNAINAFVLVNGTSIAPTFDRLDVTIPGTLYSTRPEDGSTSVQTKDFVYRAGYGAGSASATPIITATRVRGTTSLYVIMRLPTSPTSSCNDTCCWHKAEAESTCKDLGFTTPTGSGCSSGSLGCTKM